MKYIDFITENKASLENELSKLVDMDIVVKGNKIYTHDGKLILSDINKLNQETIDQKVKDYVDKHYPNEFDLEDSIQSLIYTQVPNKQVDDLLLKPRHYSNKPLYCITSNDVGNHG